MEDTWMSYLDKLKRDLKYNKGLLSQQKKQLKKLQKQVKKAPNNSVKRHFELKVDNQKYEINKTIAQIKEINESIKRA